MSERPRAVTPPLLAREALQKLNEGRGCTCGPSHLCLFHVQLGTVQAVMEEQARFLTTAVAKVDRLRAMRAPNEAEILEILRSLPEDQAQAIDSALGAVASMADRVVEKAHGERDAVRALLDAIVARDLDADDRRRCPFCYCEIHTADCRYVALGPALPSSHTQKP